MWDCGLRKVDDVISMATPVHFTQRNPASELMQRQLLSDYPPSSQLVTSWTLQEPSILRATAKSHPTSCNNPRFGRLQSNRITATFAVRFRRVVKGKKGSDGWEKAEDELRNLSLLQKTSREFQLNFVCVSFRKHVCSFLYGKGTMRSVVSGLPPFPYDWCTKYDPAPVWEGLN